MSDWTALGRSIRNLLKERGEPLTIAQYEYMQGAITGFSIVAEQIGIDEAMANIAKTATRRGAIKPPL